MILIQRGLSKRGTLHCVDLAYGESHAVIALSKGNLTLRKLGVHMEFRPTTFKQPLENDTVGELFHHRL